MHKEISGVILAGGRATRMGGEDKGLVSIGGIALYQHVLARLRPQVASVAISANRNQARYQASGLPVIGDLTPDLVAQLWRQKGAAQAAFASDGERDHPTLALLHTQIAPQLADYLARGERKLMLFLHQINAQRVVFSGQQAAFHNLNTPEDCRHWQQARELKK